MRLGWPALLVCLTLTFDAAAYTFESPLGDPCHETMTGDALRRLRAELATAAPLPSTAEDELIVEDLPFTVEDDLRDIGAAALLIGVRDNDLKGRSGIDTQDLAAIHGDENGQREHCLRRSSQDEPGGTAAAVEECRGYIRDNLVAAIDQGLDADGNVDVNKRTQILVNLAFRGPVTVSLPTFYVRLGQGLHALQDSFSHAYRTPDHRRITVMLNWVEDITGEREEARDGPEHARDMDLCRDLDAFLAARWATANEATLAAMRAVLDPTLTAAEKKNAVDAVLDDYVTYQPGCTAANAWCDAPENRYPDSTCSCRVAGATPERLAPYAWLGLGCLTFLRRWRRRCTA